MSFDVVNEASVIVGTDSHIFFISRCWCYKTISSNWAQMVISVQHKSSEGNRHLNRETSVTSFSKFPVLTFKQYEYVSYIFQVACNLHIQKGNLSCHQWRMGNKWHLTSRGWSTDLWQQCTAASVSALGLNYNDTHLHIWHSFLPPL